MIFKIHLRPRTSGVAPLVLEFRPRKNLVADKYFSQIKDFLLKDKQVDKELSYWNFALDREQKEEYVREFQRNLEILKIEPQIEMDYQVSYDDHQSLLNEIHDKFEYYLKRLNGQQMKTKHFNTITDALNQINLYIHKIENFNLTASQLERDKNFVSCAFGFRFEQDIFHALENHDYDHFTMERPFGTMLSGYNTTGKNLIHVANDNDLELVKQNKVSPQKTFSTEAYFWFGRDIDATQEYERIYRWWDENEVSKYGYKKYDRMNSLGMLPLADMIEPDIFKNKTHWEKVSVLNQYDGISQVSIT